MNPIDSLHLVVEASLALAGFAGVVTALNRRSSSTRTTLERMNLVNLLATSFGALFLSLVALLLVSAGVGEPTAWRAMSAMGLLLSIFFARRSVRTVLSLPPDSTGSRGIPALLVVNIPLAVTCLIQVWNVLALAAFWPLFLLLVSLFAIGCYSFSRLVFLTD